MPALSRLTLFERFLSIFTSVRPGEGRSVLLLLINAFLLLGAYYLIKPTRDALILAENSAEIRAYAVGVVALTLVFLLPLYKQLYAGLSDSTSRSRILRWVTAFFISNLVVFYLMGRAGMAIAVPFFIWTAVFSVMVVAQFWAFAADLYNTRSGQRLFAVIMVGASLGAVVGARAAARLYEFVGPYELMLIAAAVLALPIIGSLIAERVVPEGSQNTIPPRPVNTTFSLSQLFGGFDVVFRSRYLIALAGLMLLLNFINTTGEFILANFVEARADSFATDEQRTEFLGSFYGNYWSLVNLLSLSIQLFVVARVFRYIGVRGAVMVLPIYMLFAYGSMLLIGGFALVRAFLIGENSINYSLQNTTNQALYLPVDREQKYVGKTTIDTFFVRLGDGMHALLVFAFLNVFGAGMPAFIALNVVAAGALFFLALQIRRQHRSEIRRQMVNLPPEIRVPLPNVYVPAGQLLMFSVPEHSFMDPDPGDTLEYKAQQADGTDLPKWISFDKHNQTFSVRPPKGQGEVRVRVIARDFEGLTVEAEFVLTHGNGGSPRFEEVSESAPLPSPIG